jgi:hypothetical protein
MNSKRRDIADLDDLLQRALADDLPAEVEAGMRARIEHFRSGKLGGRTQAAAWNWMFRRDVWAVLSILMLVAGILLQGTNASSPLAKRIVSIKTALTTLETIRR